MTSIDTTMCNYAEAGVEEAYLANWYRMVKLSGAPPSPLVPVAGQIGYYADTDGQITGIVLPPTEKFYHIGAGENTISYGDTLLLGANSAKYRQHTLNAVITAEDLTLISQSDALSLGRYIAVVVGKSGNIKVLGRTGGLTAPAGGWDFASGAAAADANGWTLIQQGTSGEVAPLVSAFDVITPIDTTAIVD